MRLTIVHPAIGHRHGEKYIKTWQMEPLPVATLAGLTPAEVDISFYDDRLEHIPYDQETDLVAISVETYTARRAYQIASEYRKRGVPVVMGGFHANLCPDEVAQYAEAVVTTEAEGVWQQVLNDAANGGLNTFYSSSARPELHSLQIDRRIYQGKRYMPATLIEAGRGCSFRCEFCSIQTYFEQSQSRRPVQDIVNEIKGCGNGKQLFFFVDDNFANDVQDTSELLDALIPLNIRWVSQASINVLHDEDFVKQLAKSGCRGLLVGLESLDRSNLELMGKSFNLAQGGYDHAFELTRKYGIRIYATFVFGYDSDSFELFGQSLEFALKHNFYIAAFNHVTPFPGTPLYKRLEAENRLLYENWWLDPDYGYNRIPFRPANMTAEELEAACIETRRKFFTLKNLAVRGMDPVNRREWKLLLTYMGVNMALRKEVRQRHHYPLGDENWEGEFIKVRERVDLSGT